MEEQVVIQFGSGSAKYVRAESHATAVISLADAVEGLDPQVLLDPFEEQLHLPALFVDLGDGQRTAA
jgi:hypothetical protein